MPLTSHSPLGFVSKFCGNLKERGSDETLVVTIDINSENILSYHEK